MANFTVDVSAPAQQDATPTSSPPKDVNSFKRRKLTVRFTLGQGAFGAGGDTVEAAGLRVSCSIQRSGLFMPTANIRIHGLPMDVMNRLSIVGNGAGLLPQGSAGNVVTVLAGDDDGMSVCFTGTLQQAWIDPSDAPDISFVVVAVTQLSDKMKPVPPVSYRGSIDVGRVMGDIANGMGVPFTNNGVDVQLSNAYKAGTAVDQLQSLSRDADCNLAFDENGVSIWPRNGSRGDDVIDVNVDTGMVGYPLHTQEGITVQTLYNPAIKYGIKLNVKSILQPASGSWSIFSIVHDLESETHNGKWFTTVDCYKFGSAPAIPS